MQTVVVDLPVFIAAAVGILVLGFAIGLPVGRRTAPASKKHREVERKLDQVLQDKKSFEDEVVEHFSATATLLNNLTSSYRDVHSHLAEGADKLCRGEGPVLLGEQGSGRDVNEIPPQLAEIHQPLDYAPKVSPDQKGMLNEEFGIERKKAETAGQKQALD